MPLNNMAVEPWNKINIQQPSAAAACRVTFNTKTAAVTEAVVVQCGSVLKLLDSHVLHTEIRVLHELLYALNNSFRQHKPFCAIKQVKQCINRLKEMKLTEALQDLQELCPNQIQRNVGVDVGHCDVPSQPMLEWFCLKLLGASSLLCRTLDQCSKAFSLTRQHLHLSEFIVLNLVLTSMLSRLWVFLRGILRALVPVYQGIMDLLHDVVQCRPMAFLTDFTLPGELEAFLGPSYIDLLKESTVDPFRMKKTTKISFLDRLFEEGTEEQVEKGEEEEKEEEEKHMMQMLASQELTSDVDLGTVLHRGPPCSRSSSNVDIKSMLQQTSKQCTAEFFVKTAAPKQPSTSSLAVLEQKRIFLKKLKSASSIKEMATHLEEMMSWCRRRKQYHECSYLAFTLLRFQRIKALECEGMSVQKKLRRLRVQVHHVMLKETSLARPFHFLQQRTNCFLGTRFTSLWRRYGSVKSRRGNVRTHSQIVKDLFNVTAKLSHKCRKYRKVPLLHKNVISGSGDEQSKMETETSSIKPSNVHNDEIDNIFASFGL